MAPSTSARDASSATPTPAPRPTSATGAERTGAAVEIRHVANWSELEACVALQYEVWGGQFTDLVPASILKVTQRLGGVVAGAFDPDGRLAGFVFGTTGVERGRLVHWSDMLAVRADARDRGIGRRLKNFQRDAVAALGVSTIYWTFDPLVARNAHLNITTLGADVVEYVEDMYGPTTSSALHAGIGTDRFVVAWHIGGGVRPPAPVVGADRATAPLLNADPEGGRDRDVVAVAVPLRIDQVQQAGLAEAGRWRAETRRAFQWCFDHGYRVAAFDRDDAGGVGRYTLSRDPAERDPAERDPTARPRP
jgi:predicted GNAT superfamily acetyltransferase